MIDRCVGVGVVALALLLIGVCAVRWPSFGPIWVDGAWLLPPVAAWLAARFGRAGAIAASVAAVLLAGPAISVESLVLGGLPGLALMAIACAWAVDRRVTLASLAQGAAPHRAWVALLVLLPAFAVWPLLRSDALGLSLNWFVLALLSPLLVLAALRGAGARDAALGIAAALAIGAAWQAWTGGRLQGDGWRVGYTLMDLEYCLLATAAWSLGGALRGREPASRRVLWLVIAALILLSVDPAQLALRLPPLDLGAVRIAYTGAFAALPLAAFAAGALLGMRAAWIVAGLGLLPVLAGLGVLFFSEGRASSWLGNVLVAPTALGWGWLGAHLAGRAVEVPTLRIGGAAVIACVLAFLALVDRPLLLQLTLSTAAAVLAAALAALAARLRTRMGVTGEGWIPVAMLPIYAVAAIMVAPVLSDMLADAPAGLARLGALPLDETLFAVVTLALPLLALSVALREVGRGLAWMPKILRDLRTLARSVYQPTA